MKAVHLGLLALAVLSSEVFANEDVIYGVDNRQEVYEASPMLQKLAASTATMVADKDMTRDAGRPGLVQLNQRTLREWLETQHAPADQDKAIMSLMLDEPNAQMKFCADTRYTEQPNPGMCSGFLIAPDLLATAGHCVELENFCAEYRWVFDFKVDQQTQKAGVDLKEENIYKCKRVVSTALLSGVGLDFGIIQLDRPVTGRDPLDVRTDRNLSINTEIVVIGSPSGLPLKVAGGAKVRGNAQPFYFQANLDTFAGNSGSAVFNATTGVVEGILVRGEDDFSYNAAQMCVEAKKCDDNGCRGEDVSRMTSIPEIAVQKIFNKAAASGNTELVTKILALNTFVDFYGKDGQSALMKASENAQAETMKQLLAKNADVNLKDARGNTALHLLAKSLKNDRALALQVLIDAKANLEALNTAGETAVLKAAKNLNLEAIQLLVKTGANKNAVDLNGESALFPFARKGDAKAVQTLVSLGMDASIKNNQGQTAQDLIGKPVNVALH